MSFPSLKQAQAFFNAWKDWLGEGGRPVPSEQAQARADVCLKCPLNRDDGMADWLTRTASEVFKLQIELKNREKLRVHGEKRLFVCQGCSCNLRLKVHVPISFIRETTDQAGLDPACWILKEWTHP